MTASPPAFKTAKQLAEEQGLVGALSVEVAASMNHRPVASLDDVIRRLFATGSDQLSDPEIDYVLAEARRTGLDPVRQIAVWRDKATGKIVTHTKIDGLLAIAERTGHYLGPLPTVLTWRKGDEVIRAPMSEGPPPGEGVQLIAATCAVRREGFPEPVEVTRFWADSAPKEVRPNSAWDRMGALMLEKVALAGALRRAFPQDLAGMYESAELE